MNRLLTTLADVCHNKLLAEKWLIAPSRRVGHQWLDGTALAGTPAVNVHVKTLRSLAIDLASPLMTMQDVTLVSPQESLMMMDRVLCGMTGKKLKYLASAAASKGLAETVLASIEALRLSGVDATQLDDSHLEVASKAGDLRTIAREYLKALAGEKLIDYAAALEMAIRRVTQNPEYLGNETIVLVPDGVRAGAQEQQLLDALPAARRHTLVTDAPAEPSSEKSAGTDLERLRWLLLAAEAPKPLGDDSVTIRRAVGEINEVRGVLRNCLTDALLLDHVELLHTDADTYVPLVYECLSALDRGNTAPDDDLPITFAEGIPVRYSRPGRALAAWLSWIREGFPQAPLVKAIREGVFQIPGGDSEHSGLNRLAAQFRGIGIGAGRDRYLPKLDEQISGLRLQLEEAPKPNEEGEEAEQKRMARLRAELSDMEAIRRLLDQILKVTPGPGVPARQILADARQFVETLARRANKLDQFSANQLVDEIQSLEQWLTGDDWDTSLDTWQWLADLPVRLRVLGSGPRPGKLHVDNVHTGGHSGRPHTFIIGLDDSRFPGAGLQDPLLLDSERRKLSPQMPTAAARLEETIEDFARLLARLRGRLTLSFSCHAVVDDREMFPSPVLLAAYRILSGNAEADQSDLLAALDPPDSFAPAEADRSLDIGEWWLWRLCGRETIDDPRGLVHRQFPHLAQGYYAAQQRQSDNFTSYDGLVPAAGRHLDPTLDDGRVVSASGLQTLGKCPLQFFYQYGLRIKLPDEVILDPGRWLDPLAFGSLLHELFEQFMRELLAAKNLPKFDRDQARLDELLSGKIAEYKDLHPPPSQSAFESQCRKLRMAAETFLREEEQFCQETGSQPVFLEASLGLPADGHGTPLDTADPVPVMLPNGNRIRTRARIDRIDQIGKGAVQTYAIWDYKTGSTFGYDRADPFRQGRLMQPLLYVSIVAHRLREAVSPKAQVTNFGFFFPGDRAAGQRVAWSATELHAGMDILEQLCAVIHNGAFLPTNDHKIDCTFCDYQTVCGDVEAVAEASRRKLANDNNRLLKPMRELRPDG